MVEGKGAAHILGQNIKRLRARQGITQAQLAETCRISAGYLGLVESGKKFPSGRTLDAITHQLKAEVFELFLPEVFDNLVYQRMLQNFSQTLAREILDTMDQVTQRYLPGDGIKFQVAENLPPQE